jgi:hypothetical protein
MPVTRSRLQSLRSTKVGARLLQLQDRLPNELKHALMCVRRRGIWSKRGVIFVHVPKAAGTSIANALYGRSAGQMTAVQIKRYCPDLFD